MALLETIDSKVSDAIVQLEGMSETLAEINSYSDSLQTLRLSLIELNQITNSDIVNYAASVNAQLQSANEYIEAHKKDTEAIKAQLILLGVDIETEIDTVQTEIAGVKERLGELVATEQYNVFLQQNAEVIDGISQIIQVLQENVQNLDETTDAIVQSLNYGPVTPRQFGAVCDGETDDTEALQQAVNYCSETGRTLCLDGRVYLVSKPICCEVSDERKVNGLKIDGENATILIAETFDRGNGKAVFETLQFTNGEVPSEIFTRRRIEYRGLQILNPYGVVVAGIACSGVTGTSMIEDVRTDHCYHGVMFSGGWVATIRRVYATYCEKVGILIGPYKHLEYDFENDSVIYGETNQDLEIINEGWVSSSTAIPYTAANAMIIEGCRTQRCHVGIAFHGGTNVSIRDNNSELNVHAEFQATYSIASCQIENNYFENATASNSLVILGSKDAALKNGSFRHNWMLNNKLLIIGMESCEITRNTLNGVYADNPYIGPWVRKNVSQWPARYDSTPITPTPAFIRDGLYDEALPMRHGGTLSSALKNCQLVDAIRIPGEGVSKIIGSEGGMNGYLLEGVSGVGQILLIDGISCGSGTVTGVCGEREFMDMLAFCGGEVQVTAQIGETDRRYYFTNNQLVIEMTEDCVVFGNFSAKAA